MITCKHAIPVVGFPTGFPSSCHREVDSDTISGRGALGGGRGGVQRVRSVEVEGVGGVWRWREWEECGGEEVLG